ncbi:MAG: branched-chain amino acid ABC transporter permease [Deltaproteobacteria bacterium]|nr:MAG: branched-chain amino acid ABC transporter permease [Deltaproteobacteria bacterium]
MNLTGLFLIRKEELNLRSLLFTLGGVFLALAYPFVFRKPFPQDLLIKVLLFAFLGNAWNILGGLAGQVSLGHAMFFGLGAYTSTLLFLNFGVSPWVGLVAGAFLAGVVSIILGYPSFKLKGHYFAMITIAFGEVFHILFRNVDAVGGASGLFLPILDESFGNFYFGVNKIPYLYIILSFYLLSTLTIFLLDRSKVGFYLRAINSEEDAARSLGVNSALYKSVAMFFSALFTAMGGTFYAQYVTFIDPPSVYHLMLSIQIVLIVILGGVGTLFGPLVGAAVLIPLSEFTRIYLGGTGRGYDLIIYGLLIIVFAVYQPTGLMGLIRRRK